MNYDQFCNEVEGAADFLSDGMINFKAIPFPWADYCKSANENGPITATDIAAFARLLIKEAKKRIAAIEAGR